MGQKRTIFKRLVNYVSARRKRAETKSFNNALDYIEKHWDNLTREYHEDTGTIIGLPHPFVIPAADPKAEFKFEEQYYWDSYFTALALVRNGRQEMAAGMLENLLYLYKRFHLIPNSSRMYHLSHSQPPILTSYIRLVYETGTKDEAWLKERMAVAEDEYNNVWMSEVHPMWHKVHNGLSRYYDIHVLHDLAEAESGWDMTPRFERKCLDYLPIDLNCLLYKYEQDFAWAAELRKDPAEAKKWRQKAGHRQHEINKSMWHKRRGFYFDYNYSKKQQGDIWSLAGFFPMWAGLASDDQVARMVKNMARFEQKGGLTTTTRSLIDLSTVFGSLKTQWAYPNGWAPLHWLIVDGLKRYGYDEDAERIAKKWLHTNLDWYERHHEFLEKYNVVATHKPPVEGLYPSQTGFGWTNAIFVCLAQDYYGEAPAEQESARET